MRHSPLALLVVLAGLSLGAVSAAQSQKGKLFKRAGGSVRQASLDLKTGIYTRGPVVHDRGGTTVADFRNLDVFDGAGVGWLSVDTGAGSCRWFSNAAKGFGVNQSQNASDLVTDIVFFYCSNALDVDSGGAGGSVTLGFYEGYTLFGGTPTTTVMVISLTGMPANTSDGSFFTAGAGCYGLRVTFPTMVTFADNQFIGYSWQYDDLGTDGTLGNTYPFVACVVSCSGTSLINGNAGGAGTATGLGEDGQGMLDAIDQYCISPAVTATFTFGTVGAPFAPTTRTSMNMQIIEAGDLATTNVNYNASTTPNADTLSATKATLGSVWTATLTKATTSGAGSILVVVSGSRHPNPNGGSTGMPQLGMPLFTGRALIAPPFFGFVSGTHNGTTGTASTTIPLTFAFCGLHFAAQCRTSGGGGGFKLSSGVEGTIGTF